MQINDSVALVTGGASGLGLATTKRLLDAGASVVVIDLKGEEVVAGLGDREDVKDLVAGLRGRRVFDEGDLAAGIWTVGTVTGLIDDVPTCDELISRIVSEAEELITGRLGGMVTPSATTESTA